MANMSYCRFENTLSDLRDCFENMEDEDLSVYEAPARISLIQLCMDIARDYEYVVEEHYDLAAR